VPIRSQTMTTTRTTFGIARATRRNPCLGLRAKRLNRLRYLLGIAAAIRDAYVSVKQHVTP